MWSRHSKESKWKPTKESKKVKNSVAQNICWMHATVWTVSSVDICRDLYWLPVSHRVTFKLCLITWKTLHTTHPPYLSELITHYHPSRTLRPFNTNLLARPSGIVTLPLGYFLFPHHPPRTHCLHTSALLTYYQPSNVN